MGCAWHASYLFGSTVLWAKPPRISYRANRKIGGAAPSNCL